MVTSARLQPCCSRQRINLNLVKTCNIYLQPLEIADCGRQSMRTVDNQICNAIIPGILDLDIGISIRDSSKFARTHLLSPQ